MNGKEFLVYLTGYAAFLFFLAIWLIGTEASVTTRIVLAAMAIGNLIIFVMVAIFRFMEWAILER